MKKYNKGTNIEELQAYLIGFFKKELTMPSIDEICSEFGWASKNAAYKKMQLLIDCCIIRKHVGRYTFNPDEFCINFKEKKKIKDPRSEKYWQKKSKSYQKLKK